MWRLLNSTLVRLDAPAGGRSSSPARPATPWIAPDTPTLGASGAIFGLGAAYYVMARRLGADMSQVNRFMAGLLVWLLISAGLTSWQGHLGGLLAGAVVTVAYAYAPRDRRRTLVQAGACLALSVLLVVLAMAKAAELTM